MEPLPPQGKFQSNASPIEVVMTDPESVLRPGPTGELELEVSEQLPVDLSHLTPPKIEGHLSMSLSLWSEPALSLGSGIIAMMSRPSAEARLLDSKSAGRNYHSWVTYLARHRRVHHKRIKTQEIRTAFGEKRADFMEANRVLDRRLNDLQANPSDKRLAEQVLKQSHIVRKRNEPLEIAGELLNQAENELALEEYELHIALPRILRSDDDLDEVILPSKLDAADFRADAVYELAESTSGLQPGTELESGSREIISMLDAIDDLETSILVLRAQKGSLLQETLTHPKGDDVAGETAYNQLDDYDSRESRLMKELNDAIDGLDNLRLPPPDAAVLDSRETIHPTVIGTAESNGEATVIYEQTFDKSSFMSRPTSEASELFRSLHHLLHSRRMEQLTVFPHNFHHAHEGHADSFLLINYWLFHQLRVSDDQLRIYVNVLLSKFKPVVTLSPKQILDLALHLWQHDISSRISPQHQPNTTIKTNFLDSQVLLSNNAVSLSQNLNPGAETSELQRLKRQERSL